MHDKNGSAIPAAGMRQHASAGPTEARTTPRSIKRGGFQGFLNDDPGLTAYLKEISQNRVLSPKEERALILRMRDGNKQAFKDLITANLRFVVSVCRKFQHQGLPLTDLISEGNLGLIRAAQSFDGAMTCRFISYAVWWVRQRVMQALAEQSRFVSLPVSKAAVLRRMAHARKKIEQKTAQPASPSELAEFLNMKEKDVLDLLQLGRPPLSLHEPGLAEDDSPLGEVVTDESSESPEEEYANHRLHQGVHAVLACLKGPEKDVLWHYYGLGENRALTMEEIGHLLGLSPERIRQIKEKALRRLRHPCRREQLRELV